MLFYVTNIVWDSEGEDIGMTELNVEISDDELADMDNQDIEDYLSDEISNISGYCHLGFSIENFDSTL